MSHIFKVPRQYLQGRLPKISLQKPSSLIFASLIVSCVIVSAVASAGIEPSSASPTDRRAMELPAPARKFPLWSQLPTKAFVVLGEGGFGSRRWGVYAYRPTHGGGPGAVCLQIVNLRFLRAANQISVSSGAAECGDVASRSGQPVVAQADLRDGQSSIVATVAPSAVENVKFVVDPPPDLSRDLRALTVRRAGKAHLGEMSYVAFRVTRLVCMREIIGMDASGASLFKTPRRQCPLTDLRLP